MLPHAWLASSGVAAQLGTAMQLSDGFVAVAASVTPAVVRITATRPPTNDGRSPSPLELFGAPGSDRAQPSPAPRVAGGSGFVVSPDGYILTSAHVVAGATNVRVTLLDRRSFDAQIVGLDPTTDVAVIRIDAPDLPSVQLGDSDATRVGEWVLAIGNPGFEEGSTLEFTVTGGIISAKGRPLDVINRGLRAADVSAGRFAIEDFLQTDAVINPGNSGGPLVDLQGRVIGINTAIASGTGYYQGYGFAVPSNLVRQVMSDLIRHGRVRRAQLGLSITNVTAEDAEIYRLPSISGVKVEDFASGSPAQRAGVRRHDVIVAVDGAPVDRVGQVQRLIATREPGETVEVTVIRYGETHRFRVPLLEAELPDALAQPMPAAPASPRGLGLQLTDITPALARELNLDGAEGVVVSNVTGAAAASRLIQPMDRILMINGRAVGSADQARALIEALRPGEIASILLEGRSGRTRIANLRVP